MIKKIIIFLLCSLIILNIPSKVYSDEDNISSAAMKQDILVLMLAYPEYITDIQLDNDKVYLVMKSNKKLLYDDKLEKTHQEKLNNPDLQDMLEQPYPLIKNDDVMDKNFDPGRARHYELLNEVYGSSQNSIESNLKSLKYAYPNYQFNKNNNACDSLNNALKELTALSKNNINSILYPASGTYNYRIISGTGRLSPHAYGIAIDLKSDRRDYWKWCPENQAKSRICEYPKELVEIFEKNNFVWGGKWGHFDILHFEYRPEIILKARYFTDWNEKDNWFSGAPIEDEYTKDCIDLIERKLN